MTLEEEGGFTDNPEAELQQFLQLVVREYLNYHGLHHTLESFYHECADHDTLSSPTSTSTWYEYSRRLNLSQLVPKYVQKMKHSGVSKPPVLQVLVAHLAAQPLLLLDDSTIVISPQGSRVSALRNTSTGLASSASLPELFRDLPVHTLQPTTSLANVTTAVTNASPALTALAASASTTQVPTPKVWKREDHENLKKKSSMPKTKSKSSSVSTSPNKGKSKSSIPSSSTSEDIMSQSWIPANMKKNMLSRNVGVVRSNVQALSYVNKRQEEYVTRNEVEQKLMDTRNEVKQWKLIPCMLCLTEFKRHNLPMTISYKSIMDLRQLWQPDMPELNPSFAKPPNCYNQVKVCLFCAQFVQNIEACRSKLHPSGAIKTIERSTLKLALTDNRNRLDPFEDQLRNPIPRPDTSSSEDSSDHDNLTRSQQGEVTERPSFMKRSKRKSKRGQLKKTKGVTQGKIGKVLSYAQYTSAEVKNEEFLHQREWDVVFDTEQRSDLFHKTKE